MESPNNLPTSTVTKPSALSEMFAGLMEVIRDPAIQPEKLAAMLAVQERMIDRQALMEYNTARMAAMQEMPYVDRDGAIKNKAGDVQSRFSTFEAIDRIVRPICAKHGLIYSFNVQEAARGGLMVTCELGHVGGHVQHYGPMPVPVDASGSKNAAQGAGSSFSYGKRYTLCGALNIVTVGLDTDGRPASQGRADDDQPEWADDVLDAARRAAIGGTTKYLAHYNTLTNMQRGWLVDMGHHVALKQAAADHGV